MQYCHRDFVYTFSGEKELIMGVYWARRAPTTFSTRGLVPTSGKISPTAKGPWENTRNLSVISPEINLWCGLHS